MERVTLEEQLAKAKETILLLSSMLYANQPHNEETLQRVGVVQDKCVCNPKGVKECRTCTHYYASDPNRCALHASHNADVAQWTSEWYWAKTADDGHEYPINPGIDCPGWEGDKE